MSVSSESGAQRCDDAEKSSVVARRKHFSSKSVSKSQETFMVYTNTSLLLLLLLGLPKLTINFIFDD